MLNKELSLKECIDILNEMAEGYIESDVDLDGIYFILVEGTKENYDLLKKLIPNEKDLEKYSEHIGMDEWKGDIDIGLIWEEICAQHDSDIWFNCKKRKFYKKD